MPEPSLAELIEELTEGIDDDDWYNILNSECIEEEEKEKECECGATSVGSSRHSYYCPLYKEE